MIEVQSIGSQPAIASCSSAASSVVRAHGQGVANADASASSPYREVPPCVGCSPTVPVNAPGWRIEQPVSVPIASGASYAEIAADEPPPEPPGIRVRSHGLWVVPYA